MRIRTQSAKDEEGSALALVLFFIIIVSLWLGSVALLTQSSSSAIKTNIAESQKRSDYVDIGVKAALQELTPNPACSSGTIDDADYDLSCRRGTLFQPCSDTTFYNRLEAVLASTEIKVRCGQSNLSGIDSSLGSLILLGDGTDCSSNCAVGRDGGLSISASGASDPTTPACSTSTGDSSRYRIYGSVINLSGKWDSVDCTDFEVATTPTDVAPKIIQPLAGEAYCPSGFSPCGVLSEWGGKASGIGSVSSLTLSKYNKINAFVNYTAGHLDAFPTTRATVSPEDADCSNSFNTSFSGKKSITILPGYISNENPASTNVLTLSRLNELTKSCGDGGSGGPAVVFQSGVYGFVGSTTSGSSSSNTWSINYSGSITGSVFAGLPNWEQDGSNFDAPCGSDPVSNGVRFLFKNYSYINLQRGKFIACASSKADPRGAGYEPIVTQPIFSAPAKNSYSNPALANFWWGSSSGVTNSYDAFYTSAQGNNSGGGCINADVCANFVGSIFAPASWLNIQLNGTTISSFKKGMFVKALTISQTGSGPPTKSVSSPGVVTNGDRQVQLNFFRRSTGQFLGSVQLKIDDSYGDKLASGYIRKAWRVGW
jgi:hypothetical protein